MTRAKIAPCAAHNVRHLQGAYVRTVKMVAERDSGNLRKRLDIRLTGLRTPAPGRIGA